MSYTRELVETVQERLQQLGYYTGQIDGEAGILTEQATTWFKDANGFLGRPYPGPLTIAALFSADAKARTLPTPRTGEPMWLAEARALLGTREVVGPGDNPVIMEWAARHGIWYPDDDTPWCGLFVAHCMAIGSPNESRPENPLGARNWLEFGVPAGAEEGAIAVFWRTHPTKSWHGHVAFVTGQSSDAIRVIGGNQSNAVTETWLSRDRVLGFRKPDGTILSDAPRASTGALSTNEA